MKKRLKWELSLSGVAICALLGGSTFTIHHNALPIHNEPHTLISYNERIQNVLNHISQQNIGKADVSYNRETNTLIFMVNHSQYMHVVKSNAKPDAILLGQQTHTKVKILVAMSKQAKHDTQFQHKEKTQQQIENRIIAERIQEAQQRAEARKEAKIHHEQAVAEHKKQEQQAQQKAKHQNNRKKNIKPKANKPQKQNSKPAQKNKASQAQNKNQNKKPQKNRGNHK